MRPVREVFFGKQQPARPPLEPHGRETSPLFAVRKEVLQQNPVEIPHEMSFWRAAACLSVLREAVFTVWESENPHPNSHRGEAVRLPSVRKGFRLGRMPSGASAFSHGGEAVSV